MAEILVDSNVLLDVMTEDSEWEEWSSTMLERSAQSNILVINPIIYAELSIGFDRIEELDSALPPNMVRRDPLPWESAFLAGKCFLKYRRRGGQRTTPLPDFFIGAHAAIAKMSLLTRDAPRYRTYFPGLPVLCP